LNETAGNSAALGQAGPGRALAQLREQRKLSIADVAQRLKYGTRQIEALEAEEFDRLPGTTFVRGMVRGYAKLLETDPEPLLGALDRSYAPSEVELDLRDRGVPFAKSGKRGTRTYSVLLLLVLVVLAGVLYEWRVGAFPWARLAMRTTPPATRQAALQPAPAPAPPLEEPKPPAAPPVAVAAPPAAVAAPPAPVAVPEVAASPSPQPAPGGEGRIRLEFAGESWVEIVDANGNMLMSQLNPTGSRRTVSGRSPLSLVIGNAANVRLVYNDKPVDLKPYIQIEVARLTLN
jgi:cytoskeleton protein RodZ